MAPCDTPPEEHRVQAAMARLDHSLNTLDLQRVLRIFVQ
jgi:hypothetical protein